MSDQIPDDDFIEEYLREPLTPIKKEELAQIPQRMGKGTTRSNRT
jgi:hypothetical protein